MAITGGNATINLIGAIQVLRNAFSWKLDLHPPPHNANDVEPYTFVTLFPRKCRPHLHYVTLEWPLICVAVYNNHSSYRYLKKTKYHTNDKK